jgi:hypothetical protein
MKRSMILVMAMGMVLAVSGLAFGQGRVADATLKLTQGQVALGIGWSWGKGVLTYQGKDYPFKVEGLSVGDVGVTKAEAVGKVFDMQKVSQFNGTYTSTAAQGTLVGGAGASSLRNEKNVIVELLSTTQGLNLKLAVEGVKFTLEE